MSEMTDLIAQLTTAISQVQASQGDLVAAVQKLLAHEANPAAHYQLGEFYFFRHPTLKRGFEPLNGCTIENCATLYPDFWEYIQTIEGTKLCITETDWQELSTKPYYTLADGTEIGFDGQGGVPFFAPNFSTGSLHNPDLRGMHMECAGFDSLNVGAVAIDAIRRIQGHLGGCTSDSADAWGSGALYWSTPTHGWKSVSQPDDPGWPAGPTLDSGRVGPYGAVNRPRSLGVLACSYMGVPAL